MRNVISDLKQRLVEGEVTSYAWLPTSSIWTDVLTKEKKILPEHEDVFLHNKMKHRNTSVNKVIAVNQEVRMTNIRNRSSTDPALQSAV